MPSMNPATAPSPGLGRWRYVRTGGSALFTAWRTSRRWTPNFRATPLIVPIPNSYSRRNCSNSSTFVLLSTPPLPLVQRNDGTPREKGGPNSVSKVGRHPIANSLRPFPPRSPPPTCRPVLFEVSQVLCSLLRPSDPASAPRLPEPTRNHQGGCGRPEVSQVPTRSVTARTGLRWSPRLTVPHMLPAAVRSASASTVRSFRSSIQSSSSRCVRFATIVADDPATLATGRALSPTRSTGWIAPASPGAHKQLLCLCQ